MCSRGIGLLRQAQDKGEAFGGDGAKRCATVATKREVVAGGQCRARLTCDDAGGIQMVAQQVEDAVVRRIAGAAQGVALVILGGGRTLLLEDARNIDGRHPVHGSLDSVAVGIVDKRRAGAAARNGRQPVLVVVGEGVGDAADDAGNLVAPSAPLRAGSAIIGVAVAKGRGHGVGFGAVGVGTARIAGNPSAGSGQVLPMLL